MRSATFADRLRKLLLDNPAGMTIKELAEADGCTQESVIGAMYRNYGFYIGGWERMSAAQYRAVWRCVRVPDKAPKPKGEFRQVDMDEAHRQRKRADRKSVEEELRKRRHRVRKELKAQREREKLEAKQRKAEAKAERERLKEEERAERLKRKHAMPAGGAGYVPQLTRWAPVQPWPEGARP